MLTAGELLLGVAESTGAIEGIEAVMDVVAAAVLDAADVLSCADEGETDEREELEDGPCSSVMVLVSVLCSVKRLVAVVC